MLFQLLFGKKHAQTLFCFQLPCVLEQKIFFSLFSAVFKQGTTEQIFLGRTTSKTISTINPHRQLRSLQFRNEVLILTTQNQNVSLPFKAENTGWERSKNILHQCQKALKSNLRSRARKSTWFCSVPRSQNQRQNGKSKYTNITHLFSPSINSFK